MQLFPFAEFSKNTQALRVINSFCHVTGKGNCRGGDVEVPDESLEPLPKRRCSRSKVHHTETQVALGSSGMNSSMTEFSFFKLNIIFFLYRK